MKRVHAAVFAVLISVNVWAEEPVDLGMVAKIRAEGMEKSQVMQTLSGLTDFLGPRLTGSPAMRRANEWCRDQMSGWGLENAHLESWGKFGRGWELERFSIEMSRPYFVNIIAWPEAWTESTRGTVFGKPVLVEAQTPEELEKYKGKLAGAIVLTPLTREVRTTFEPDAKRYTAEELVGMAQAATSQPASRPRGPESRAESRPSSRPGSRPAGDFRGRRELQRQMNEMFRKEGVAAVLRPSRGEHGTMFVQGGGAREGDAALPTLIVAVEHYGIIARLLARGVDVNIELSVQTRFFEDVEEFNVVGEIRGEDAALRDELVMLGGHLDSWHSATGATDNAAGCAVALEAVRILKAIGARPRRTIRVALWSGEEQGLLGSRAYVTKHFADRQSMDLTPEHDKFSAYFNLDNGTGRVRGIYCQGNEAVRPIFAAWLAPFRDLEATTVTIRNTGGTDHQSFDAVGLPGFQFIQDTIDYDTRTHHTNMDFYERAQAGDLKQAATIMASFVYHAAMRDEKLPRKPLPEPRSREEQRSRDEPRPTSAEATGR